MKAFLLATSLAVVALTACSSPYQPKTRLNGGYSDLPLAPDSYRVTYEAPADSSAATHLRDLALLRATELCRQTGCAYLKLIQQSDESSVAGTSITGLPNPPLPHVIGSGSTTRGANNLPRPEALARQATVVVRKLVIEIRTFREKPAGIGVIEVEPLFTRLSAQYR